ncbi:hypothetical protein BJX64DRAFT_78005 [Aspergillus heterothallicus]
MRPYEIPRPEDLGKLQADNWHGVWDAKERRRRQNRINQRAHRLRTRRQQGYEDADPYLRGNDPVQVPQPQPSTANNSLLSLEPRPIELPNRRTYPESLPEQVERLESALLTISTESRPFPVSIPSPETSSSAAADTALSIFMSTQAAKISTLCLKIPDANKKAILMRQVARFHSSYKLNCPSADHLLSLTRVNVHRAFVANMVALGVTWEWMKEESISPFFVSGPAVVPGAVAALPEKMRPTELQRRSVHHTWIDLFPCPVMRDNLIRRGNDWDDEELCVDIMGYWDGNSTGPHGLIVWGEPGDTASWEVTEGFLSKWGWLVRGCVELMRSTNYWRAKRSLRPLFPNTVAYSR